MTHPHPVVTSPLQTRLSLGVVAALALLSLVAGCAGGPSRHPRVHDEPRQPPLAARADFFAGAITAEAQVVSFRHSMMHPDRDGEGRGGDRAHSGPPPGGGKGMGHAGGMGAGGPPPGEGGDHRRRDNAHPAGGPVALPRQTLSISFTNHTAAPLTFVITELNSGIGNFVPQPEKLTLAPGATEALQPVSGDAGGVLRWLDVTLSLRQGGTTTSQILHLVPTGEPAEAEPPPPPPQR